MKKETKERMRQKTKTRNKVKINICMGSACFARGNKNIIETVKRFIRKNNMQDSIELKGELCTGECDKGPNAKINDRIYHDLSETKILEILKRIEDEKL